MNDIFSFGYRHIWMSSLYQIYVGDSTNPTKRPSIDEYSRFPQPATGLSSSHTSLLSSSVCLNQNPYKLDKGSAIQYGDPPKYGVIKQIRKISGCDKTLFADVEMVCMLSEYMHNYIKVICM